MKLIIDISEERYKDVQRIASVQADRNHFQTAEQIIANGTPIPDNEQKTGRWIRVKDKTEHWVWKCDKCGWQQRFDTNHCPDCGAKMVEPHESEKVNCKSTKCDNCINHNYCDYEPQESENKE